jgi:hypothetical protein
VLEPLETPLVQEAQMETVVLALHLRLQAQA